MVTLILEEILNRHAEEWEDCPYSIKKDRDGEWVVATDTTKLKQGIPNFSVSDSTDLALVIDEEGPSLMEQKNPLCSGIVSEYDGLSKPPPLGAMRNPTDVFYGKFPLKETPKWVSMASSTLQKITRELGAETSQNNSKIDYSSLHGIPIRVEEGIPFGTYVVEYMDGSQEEVSVEL
jgi:hypothetical protein